MDKVWQKIQQVLLEPDKYPTVKIDLSELSPLSPEMLKIPMVGQINLNQFIEIIARNFLNQQLELQSSTWAAIKEIYEGVEKEKNAEIFLDMLLVVSKLDINEYCKYYRVESSKLSNQQFFEKSFLLSFLREVKNRLIKQDVLLANQVIMNEIKNILTQPSIMSAYADGLSKLGLKNDIAEIKNYINNMQIYFCKSLGDKIKGLTMRSGIMVSMSWCPVDALGLDLKETVEKFLLNMDGIKYKAWIITKCCHETAHFLARSFSNDFHFSSPQFCCDKDPHDETKIFEFGRHIELRLFKIQPNWLGSSEQAAMDFINNAFLKKDLPLICRKEEDLEYLVARIEPSLSFAGDVEVIDFDGWL